MFFVIACICLGFLSGQVSGQSDYTLEFHTQEVTDYVNIWGMPSLARFTVCFWVKTTATATVSPFSYASTADLTNELLVDNPSNFELYVGNDNRNMGITANDGNWHHICATWKSSDGEWKSYKDGALVNQGTGFKTGHTITGGGSLVLGQEQDSVGGGFQSSQSFTGMLANVNVWSFVLPGASIRELSKCCRSGEGNVYKWEDFIHGIKGNPHLVIPAGCPCNL